MAIPSGFSDDVGAMMALDGINLDQIGTSSIYNHQPAPESYLADIASDPLALTCFNFNDDTLSATVATDFNSFDLLMDLPNYRISLVANEETSHSGPVIPTSKVSNDDDNSLVTPPTTRIGWATKNEWTQYRPLITQLYKDRMLGKVMSIMESRYGFRSTLVNNI